MSKNEKSQAQSYPSNEDAAHWRTYNARVSGLLGAADLGGLGKDDRGNIDTSHDRHVVISGFKQDKVKNRDNTKGSSKLILSLSNSQGKPAFVDADGQELKWPVNSTNGEMIEKLVGSGVPRRWIGRVITLYVDEFDDRKEGRQPNGKFLQTRGIRVRDVLPPHDAKLRAKNLPPSNTKGALPAAADPRPPINTNNDESQTYVPPDPSLADDGDDSVDDDANAMPSV